MCTLNKQIHIHILVAMPFISFLARETELKSLETAAISSSLYRSLPKSLERGSRQPCPPRLLRTLSEIFIWHPLASWTYTSLNSSACPSGLPTRSVHPAWRMKKSMDMKSKDYSWSAVWSLASTVPLWASVPHLLAQGALYRGAAPWGFVILSWKLEASSPAGNLSSL